MKRKTLIASFLIAVLSSIIIVKIFSTQSKNIIFKNKITTVQKIINSSKTHDDPTFKSNITKNAIFWPNFDLYAPLNIDNFADFLGSRSPVRYYSGLETITVQFDCEKHIDSEFIVDFRFCGEKVGEVRRDEVGRTIRSPLFFDLIRRFFGTKNDTWPNPCAIS